MAGNPKAKAAGAAGFGAMALALGIWIFSEGDGPKHGADFLAYQDIAKVWTICHGHAGKDVKPGQTATKAQCDALAQSDLGRGFDAEDKYVTNVMDLPIWTRAAVADFIGSAGVGAFRTSSVLRLLNEGPPKINDACNAMLLYDKSRAGPMGQLVVVTGLINRRVRERHLCRGEEWE